MLKVFGQEAKLEVSTVKGQGVIEAGRESRLGRADFVHCMRVCAKTLHLLQGSALVFSPPNNV